MRVSARDIVGRFLLATALGLFSACGSDSADVAQGTTANSPSPTVNTNSAPVIDPAGSQYARVGVPFEFQATASDSDGDPLTFSSNNLPTWATLDSLTGRITGTPSADDVGAYESIVITVADAGHSAHSGAFEITVLPGATGMASLQWETPGSKVDGSPLDDLAGYRILFGRSPDDLDQSVYIDGASLNTYDFPALDSGIWYFAVVAVSASGLEGPPSTVAMKSI